MQNEPKISTPEAFIWVTVCIIADVLSIFPAVNLIVWVIMAPSQWLYLKTKGVQSQRALISSIIEIIPGLSVLPAYTFGAIITIYLDRHPEQAEKLQVVQKIKKPKGSIPAPAPKQ